MQRKAAERHETPQTSTAGFEPATSGFGGRKPTPQPPEPASTYDGSSAGVTPTGTTSDENITPDADLEKIVAAWPTLPEAARVCILAMVRAATIK